MSQTCQSDLSEEDADCEESLEDQLQHCPSKNASLRALMSSALWDTKVNKEAHVAVLQIPCKGTPAKKAMDNEIALAEWP